MTNNKMPFMMGQRNNSILFRDILVFLKIGWRWFIVGGVLGLVCAVTYLVLTPKKFEAMAIIQPATVGVSYANTARGAEVEPIGETLERLKLASFYDDALVQICQATSSQRLAESVISSQVKGNWLIKLSYRAPSREVAEACVNAVMAQLVKSQLQVAAPLIEKIEEVLVSTERRLSETESLLSMHKKRITSMDPGLETLAFLLSKQDNTAGLTKLILELKIQLSAPMTQPMKFLEPVYASVEPAFPKKLPALAAGFFGGLLLGGLVFFLSQSWPKHRI